jgi:hypothetical protein
MEGTFALQISSDPLVVLRYQFRPEAVDPLHGKLSTTCDSITLQLCNTDQSTVFSWTGESIETSDTCLVLDTVNQMCTLHTIQDNIVLSSPTRAEHQDTSEFKQALAFFQGLDTLSSSSDSDSSSSSSSDSDSSSSDSTHMDLDQDLNDAFDQVFDEHESSPQPMSLSQHFAKHPPNSDSD